MKKKRGSKAEVVSDRELAEWRRAVLSQKADDALAELQEIATSGAEGADGAALSLVGAAVDACKRVLDAANKSPGVFSPLAKKMPRWPVVYSVWPDDEKALAEHIRGLGVGSETLMGRSRGTASRKWSIDTAENRWAWGYVQLVEQCWLAKNFCVNASEATTYFSETRGIELVFEADYYDAIKLPPISNQPDVFETWKAAFLAHVARHHSAASLMAHEDWASVREHKAPNIKKGKLKNDPEQFVRQVQGKLCDGLKIIFRGA